MSKTIASALCASLAALIMAGSVASAADHDKVTFTIDKWRKAGSNNIGTADITIDNGNDFAISGIRVRCDYVVKAGGKKIETEQTVAIKLKAKTKKTFKRTKFPYIEVSEADGACKILGATKM